MTNSVTKMQVLALYKNLLKESQKFTNYNFREYALRRVRDAFRENKNLSDQKTLKLEFENGKQQLEVIKRQVLVGQMYQTEKLVIEPQ